MTAGPATRSQPICQGVVRSPRRQRRERSKAPRPATAAAPPPRTRVTASRPIPGMRRPSAASATPAAPSSTPRTTAIAPPAAQRMPEAWYATRAVVVEGSSAADCTPPCWQGRLSSRRRSVGRMSSSAPATLAAWLRTRSDEQLAALLAARPDVARPAPSDVVALASRLAVPVSVDRALDELDAGTLQVLDVVLLADTDGIAAAELIAALPDLDDAVLDAAVQTLTARALLWGDDL